MAAPTYLTKRGEVFYVQVPVPKAAQAAVGSKTLERSLRTRDETQALRLRHGVIAEFQQFISEASNAAAPISAEAVLQEARHLRSEVDAGRLARREADVALWAAVDSLLEARVPHVGHDEEGEVDLPAPEVATVRRAFTALSGDEALMLDRLAAKWLESEAASQIRRATLADKQRHIEMFLRWTGEHTHVVDVNRRRATDFVEKALLPWTRVPKRGAEPVPVATNKKRLVLQSVHQMFDWLEIRGTIDANPFDKLSTLIRTSARGEDFVQAHRAWQPDEFLKLLRGITDHNDPIWSLAVLLAFSGARREDICEIKLEHVAADYIFIPVGKNGYARRNMPIHPEIAPLVQRLVETSSDGYLIPGLLRSGKDRKRGIQVGKRLLDMVRNVGLEDRQLVVHGFRNSVLTQLEAANVSLRVRQQTIGQKSSSIAERHYTDPTEVPRLVSSIAHVTYGEEVATRIRELAPTVHITRVSIPRKPELHLRST